MLNNRSGNLYYCIYYIMKGIIIIKQSYHYVYFMMRTLSGEFQDCRIQPDNRRYSENCRPSDEFFM